MSKQQKFNVFWVSIALFLFFFVLTNCVPAFAASASSGCAVANEMGGSLPSGGAAKVGFSEFLVNPVGRDTDSEFIELKNLGGAMADLAGWSVVDGKDKKYVIPDLVIQPGKEHAFPYSETKITLTNSGNTLKLYDRSDVLVDSVTYNDGIPEGSSCAINSGGVWLLTETSTPSLTNRFTTKGTDGDQTEADGTNNEEGIAYNADAEEPSDEKPAGTSYAGKTAIISEFIPNPEGTDDAEWIELYNTESQAASLAGWMLDDEEGGSKPYTFGDGAAIQAGEFLVVNRSESGIALNNTGDTVRLLTPSGEVADSVTYGAAKEGESYSLSGTEWAWTAEISPGSQNSGDPITGGEQDTGDETDEDSGDEDEEKSDDGDKDEAAAAEMKDLYEMDAGTVVVVRGVVTLPPGHIGKTIFAIQNYNGGAGAHVRMYGNDNPELKKGDKVTVTGKVSFTGGEMRLTSGKGGVTLDNGSHDVAYTEKQIRDITQTDAGTAVSISEKVIDSGKSWILLADEDVSHEIRVRLPGGESIGTFQDQALVTANGVVRYRKDTAEILVSSRQGVSAPAVVADETETGTSEEPAEEQDDHGTLALSSSSGKGSTPAILMTIVPTLGIIGYILWRKLRNAKLMPTHG